MKRSMLTMAILAALLVAIDSTLASEVTGLTTFTANTPARASEVNGNFTATKTAVDDNHRRVAALEAAIATLQSSVTTQAVTITELQAKLASVSTLTWNGQPTVRFTGVNVQIVNGMDATGTANGRGNLIVGYDEPDVSSTPRCTLGTNPTTGAALTDQAACEGAGGIWTTEGFKTGSHYVVAGNQNNYSRWGGVVFGHSNTSNYDYASVTGGYGHTASGRFASVSGGAYNRASGYGASVSGGDRNTAGGLYASVSGGRENTSSSERASVSGGQLNTASGSYATVSGGLSNNATASNTTIAGGARNEASGNYASVSGGEFNSASGQYATVNGGYTNNAAGQYSGVSGGQGCNPGSGTTTIWAVGLRGASGCNSALSN